MSLVECEERLDALGLRYEALEDKLQAEREAADSAMANAEHALEYLTRFNGKSNAVAIALSSLQDCVFNLQSRFKTCPNGGG